MEKKERELSPIQEIVNYFFELKDWANKEKEWYKENNINYSRYVRSAKQLLRLCDDDVSMAKEKLKTISVWADSRNLNWNIGTSIKRWIGIDLLKEKKYD